MLFLNVFANNTGGSGSGRGGDGATAQGMPRDRNLRMKRGTAKEIRDVLTNPRRIDRKAQGMRRDLRSIGARAR